VTLEGRRAGDAIAASAGELVRLWRANRAQARPDVWPGLLDGLAEDFLVRAGDALAEGRDPALVWPSTAGLVRMDPRALDRTRAEIDAEWDLVSGVLSAACDALEAGEAAREWLARAIVIARTGARTLDEGGGPRGIVVAWSLAGLAGARRARAPGRP